MADAQARLRADGAALLRAQADSSTPAHGPPRPPQPAAVEPLDLAQLNIGLPTGWRCLEHENFAGVPMYVHSATRTVSWGRPIACDVLEADGFAAAHRRGGGLLDFLPEAAKMVAEAAAPRRRPGRRWTSTTASKATSGGCHGSRQSPASSSTSRRTTASAPTAMLVRFLRHYTSACLGAHADLGGAGDVGRVGAPAGRADLRRPRRAGGHGVPHVGAGRPWAGGRRRAHETLPGAWSAFRDRWALRPSSRQSSTRRCSTTSASTTRACATSIFACPSRRR